MPLAQLLLLCAFNDGLLQIHIQLAQEYICNACSGTMFSILAHCSFYKEQYIILNKSIPIQFISKIIHWYRNVVDSKIWKRLASELPSSSLTQSTKMVYIIVTHKSYNFTFYYINYSFKLHSDNFTPYFVLYLKSTLFSYFLVLESICILDSVKYTTYYSSTF